MSALPNALLESGEILDAMVLLYPREAGVSAMQPETFGIETAEWIVLINSRAS